MQAILRRDIRRPFAYAAAAALAALAWLIVRALPEMASPDVALSIFMIAVIGAGLLAGGAVALAVAAFGVATVDYLIPQAGTWKLPYTVQDTVSFFLFIVAAGAAAWLAQVARGATHARGRAKVLSARLSSDARHREALLELGNRALAGGSLEAISRDANSIITNVLDVKHCAIFELKGDGGPLVVSTSTGWEADTVEGLMMPVDADTQVGYALYARDAVIVSDADAEKRFTFPEALRDRGIRSGVATRIATAARPFGVVVACSTSPRTYDTEDVQFLRCVAAVLAGMYERKRLDAERAELAARDKANRVSAELETKRAAFLTHTATVFDAALDPEETLVSLARLAVPALAECAMVDFVSEDGHVCCIEVVDIDPTRREAAQALRRQAPGRRTSPLSRAIRTGQPVLLSQSRDRGTEAGSAREHEELMRVLQCRSLLLIPLVARGQTLGLLTLASRERLYETADLSIARELAARAAISLDNARLYREVQAASRAKDDFLAMISHEMRTPINAVLGWTAMLREHRFDGARAEYACEAIERSARAQARLLEQLLDVSRAVSGKLELHLAATDIARIVEAAIDAVRPDADDKKVRIAARIDRDIPMCQVDAERLQQVVVNVVSNAIKFSAEDGLVELDLRRDDGVVELRVRDQGIGITREFLPYVFERFRQAAAKPRGINRGLGLGMSIARDIVERHGGTIAAESDGEGRGSTFTVRLPLRLVAEPSLVASRVESTVEEKT